MKILDSSIGVKGNFGWRVFLLGALAGLSVSTALYAAYWFAGHTFGEVELAFWPAAVVLQAIDGGSAAQMASAVVAAALTNAALYGVLALLTHLAWRGIRHRSSER